MTVYNNISKTAQIRLGDIQDSWLSSKADEIQSFANIEVMKKFYNALKTHYGPKRSETTPRLIQYRWKFRGAVHFWQMKTLS